VSQIATESSAIAEYLDANIPSAPTAGLTAKSGERMGRLIRILMRVDSAVETPRRRAVGRRDRVQDIYEGDRSLARGTMLQN
jgi:glutathione S-transferase